MLSVVVEGVLPANVKTLLPLVMVTPLTFGSLSSATNSCMNCTLPLALEKMWVSFHK